MKKTLLPIAIVFFGVFSLFALPQKQFKATVAGLSDSAALANFPVLVRLSPERISGFAYADIKPNGEDLVFSLADGTVLDYEIDTWDTAGESLVWVKVPAMLNGTEIIVSYKDASAAAQSSGGAQRLWSGSGHIGVWHMREESGAVPDSCNNGLDAVPMGDAGQSFAVEAGVVGKARQTAKSGKAYLSVPSYDSFGLGENFTISGWMKVTANHSGYPRIFSRKNGYADGNGWECEVPSGSYTSISSRGRNSTSHSTTFPSSIKDSWNHLALVYSGSTVTVYFNGEKRSSGGIASASDNGLPLSIGCNSNGSEGYIPGEFDECRLHSAVRDGDWIAAEYATVNNEAFLAYSPVELLQQDDTLFIEGDPSEIGSPDPGYGTLQGLSQNETRTLSVAETVVPGEGAVTNVLAGWELYVTNPESQTEELARSSLDAGESIGRCSYVHNGGARFVWKWHVKDALGASTPTAVSTSENGAAVSVPVSGAGYGSEGAELMLVYGLSPEGMDLTNSYPSRVLFAGDCTIGIDRLLPGRIYYAKGVMTGPGGETVQTDVMSFETQPAPPVKGDPGLWQAFFTSANGDWTKDVRSLPEGEDWRQYKDADRIRRRELLPIGAYLGGSPNATKYLSEVWGDYVSWPVNGGQWAYIGYIWLDASKIYKFRTKIDDREYIAITDIATQTKTVLVNDMANLSSVVTSPSYFPLKTGWHEIEIRFSDGSGGAGGYNSANNYKNTENLGYSEDNGTSWKILEDPGDGSLLAADLGGTLELREQVQNGRQSAILIRTDAAPQARVLCVAMDTENRGANPEDWAVHGTVIGTLQAGQSEFVYALPQSWGADYTVAMVYTRDLGDMSMPFYWRDASYPAMEELELDGSGGDTLRLSSGSLSCPGACTIRVLAGESEDNLDKVFENFEGCVVEGSSFDISLFAPEGSENYLEPGKTYFVAIDMTSQGKTVRTTPQKVRMLGAAELGSPSATVDRRKITAKVGVVSLGTGGEAVVELFGSDTDDEASFAKLGDSILAKPGDATVAATFPLFEKTYWLQFRIKSTTQGGTASFETRSAVFSAATQDKTTYTWNPDSLEGDWTDSANWTDNQGGDCLGWPQGSSAVAAFPNLLSAKVRLTEAVTVGSLHLTGNDMRVSFIQGGASTNETQIAVTAIALTGKSCEIVFDGTSLKASSTATLGQGTALKLANGANLHLANLYNNAKSSIELRGGSYLSCAEFFFGGGSNLTIDDSQFSARSHSHIGYTSAGGSVRFEGKSPLYTVQSASACFRPYIASSGVTLDFLVPAGGYSKAPIQGHASATVKMGQGASSPITVNVLEESPANYVDATITTPLASWPSAGIDTANVLEGSLPSDGGETDDSFIWDESVPPKTLSARIKGSTHASSLLVSGYPENIASQVSPGYGYHAAPQGSAITFTAPAEPVILSEGKRAVIGGWKLYRVDGATMEKTLVSSGTGNSVEYQGSDAWHELVWQWRIEYKITVAGAANGSAQAQSEWVEDGTAAIITATPQPGYGFGKWTGDVSGYDDKTEPLSFTVEGRPYAIAPSFRKAVHFSGGKRFQRRHKPGRCAQDRRRGAGQGRYALYSGT